MSQKLKVLINIQYGGFWLSDEVVNLYNKSKPESSKDINAYSVVRHDPHLIQIVENLGLNASAGNHCDLRIIQIPAEFEPVYEIREYDGREWINYHAGDLIEYKLNQSFNDQSDVDKLSESECRSLLKDFIRIRDLKKRSFDRKIHQF